MTTVCRQYRQVKNDKLQFDLGNLMVVIAYMAKKKYPPNWIRHFRAEAGMTAQELGQRVNISKDGITLIERQERSLSVEMAKKIADVFEVHYSDIIDGPTETVIARTESQKKLLRELEHANLSDREQDLYINAFLSGLNTPKPAAHKASKHNEKKNVPG